MRLVSKCKEFGDVTINLFAAILSRAIIEKVVQFVDVIIVAKS